MFRVYDNIGRKWVDNSKILLSPQGQLVEIKRKLFITKLTWIGEKYSYQNSIGVFDKNEQMIFEGDIIEANNKIGIVVYSEQLLSYIAINKKDNKYYPLNDKFCEEKVQVIGNNFDNPDLLKAIEGEVVNSNQ